MYRPSQIAFSVPKASSDGLYWPRYPQGNAPAHLAGSAAIGSAATASATTKIKLAAAAQVGAAGSGTL
jgi:hypothetical protein